MQQDLSNNFFFQVLSIVGYKGDKIEFTKKFYDLCILQLLVNLIQTKSKEEQEMLKKDISNKSIISMTQVLQRHFTQYQIHSGVVEVIILLLKDYSDSIQPALSPMQSHTLEMYIEKIQSELKIYTFS